MGLRTWRRRGKGGKKEDVKRGGVRELDGWMESSHERPESLVTCCLYTGCINACKDRALMCACILVTVSLSDLAVLDQSATLWLLQEVEAYSDSGQQLF